MLVEGICFEHLRYFLVEPGYQLIDGLLPRLLLVALVMDCIEKVPHCLLDHLSEYLR